MKRIVCLAICLFVLYAISWSFDAHFQHQIPLRKATHINQTLTPWDTVFAVIYDSNNTAIDTVYLSSNSAGKYYGTWIPTGIGNFIAEYNAVYSGDTVVEEEYFSVIDTEAFHGAAAGLTAKEIADTLQLRGCCCQPDSGANQVIVRVKSESDSAVIPGAGIAVWNSDQSAFLRLKSSDTDSGKATFALDNGIYNLRVQAYKFQFDVPIRIGVSGNKDTTIYATEFTPSPPPSENMVIVYGYLDSVGLAGTRAKISCTIHTQNLRVGSMLLAHHSYTKTVYTDVHGYWEMALYPNDAITPSGTLYHFIIESPYTYTFEMRLEVPSGVGSWELTW